MSQRQRGALCRADRGSSRDSSPLGEMLFSTGVLTSPITGRAPGCDKCQGIADTETGAALDRLFSEVRVAAAEERASQAEISAALVEIRADGFRSRDEVLRAVRGLAEEPWKITATLREALDDVRDTCREPRSSAPLDPPTCLAEASAVPVAMDDGRAAGEDCQGPRKGRDANEDWQAEPAGEPETDALELFKTSPKVVKPAEIHLDSAKSMVSRLKTCELDAFENVTKDYKSKHAILGHPAVLTLRRWFVVFMNLEEPVRHGCLADFVMHNQPFKLACVLVISLNAMFAAYVADWEMRHIGEPMSSQIRITELALVCFYLVELLLKLAVHRIFFFCNYDWGWNSFDFVLVSFAIYEQSSNLLTMVGMPGIVPTSSSSATFMRTFRLMKMSKVMRLFRVFQFCQDLRMMLLAIQRSFSSLFWCLILLCFVLYAFGLVMIQGCAGYLSELQLRQREDDMDVASMEVALWTEQMIHEYFGSMKETILSLYKATTGGADWGQYFDVITNVGVFYSMLFIFYTAFFTFTVMNILTGMIVENVVKMTQGDDECLQLVYRQQQDSLVTEIQRVFKSLDTKHTGGIGSKEFHQGMQSVKVRALMASIELEIRDAEWFFNMLLSVSDTDVVDIEHFVDTCLKMKGQATSIDLQCVHYEVRVIRKMFAQLQSQLASVGSMPIERETSMSLSVFR